MRKILVIRGGALGDGLLTLPVLAALRTRWPQAAITLIGPRTLLPFAAAARLVDRSLPIEDAAGLALMRESDGGPEWADVDLAVLWLHQRLEVARRLEHWGVPTVVAGASLPTPDDPTHVADLLHVPLAPLGIGPGRLALPLPTPESGRKASLDWWNAHLPQGKQTVVAIHPGSGGRHKCWPARHFAGLASALAAAGHQVLLCLGPAEAACPAQGGPRWQDLPSLVVASDLELAVLAGVLQRCDAFIGNDAGVTHLAAALGVPTLSLFGPTNPSHWAPQGRRVRSVRDPAWIGHTTEAPSAAWTLSVQQVLAEYTMVLAQAASEPADTEP